MTWVTMPELVLNRSSFNPGQWKLLRSMYPYNLLAGGVGSGKTTGLVAKMLQLRELNWGFPGLLIAPTWPIMKGVTLRELLRVHRLTYPERRKPRVKDPSGDRYLDFLDGGEPLFLRTAKNPGSIEGFSVGYGGGDEARWWPREAYRNFIARIRLKSPYPQACLASTPSLGWLADEFDSGKKGRRLITAPTRENLRNLRDGYIEDLMVSYSPRVARAILEGEFIALEGVVYESFDGRVDSDWVVDWEPTRADFDRCKIYLAIDPGWRRSSWLFIIERRPLQWVVFKQMQLDNTSDMTAIQLVNQLDYPIDEIWVDPAADATQSVHGVDTIHALRHIKGRAVNQRIIRTIAHTPMLRHIPWGIDKTRILLGGYEGFPIRLKFTKRLVEEEQGKDRGIIRSLGNYSYPEVKDGRAVTDIPLKDGVTDHDCDALRYWSIGRTICTPQLRKRDPDLVKNKDLGYRIAE